jgi:hypothetical protein
MCWLDDSGHLSGLYWSVVADRPLPPDELLGTVSQWPYLRSSLDPSGAESTMRRLATRLRASGASARQEGPRVAAETRRGMIHARDIVGVQLLEVLAIWLAMGCACGPRSSYGSSRAGFATTTGSSGRSRCWAVPFRPRGSRSTPKSIPKDIGKSSIRSLSITRAPAWSTSTVSSGRTGRRPTRSAWLCPPPDRTTTPYTSGTSNVVKVHVNP